MIDHLPHRGDECAWTCAQHMDDPADDGTATRPQQASVRVGRFEGTHAS